MNLRALWTLGRPRLIWHLYAMVLGGFGWAHWNRAWSFRGGRELLWVTAAWIALHLGTMWLNAAVDRDEGEVFFGEAAPVPPGTAQVGFAALIVAVLCGGMGNAWTFGCTVACALLSVAYSHPRLLWKGHPVLGPMVNGVGYGVLTPTVGFACVGAPIDQRTVAMVALTATAVLGAYYAAQVFQEEEDRERGYRTLVATHGPRAALDAATGLLTLSWIGLMVLAAMGWLPRLLLIAGPGWWWVIRWFRTWAAAPGGGSESYARELARRVAILALFAFFLVFVEYAHESFSGVPVAGLGTAAGQPVF